jgi:hypothetical protein
MVSPNNGILKFSLLKKDQALAKYNTTFPLNSESWWLAARHGFGLSELLWCGNPNTAGVFCLSVTAFFFV